MTKIIFYHLWQFEKLERRLKQMDAKGYKLIAAKNPYLFYFEKNINSNTNEEQIYIIFYFDERKSRYKYIKPLIDNYKINEIEISAFRTCYVITLKKNKNEKIKKFIDERNKYIKIVLFKRFLGSLIFMLIAFILFVLSLVNGNTNTNFLLFIFFMNLLITFYHVYGYSKSKKKEHRGLLA